MIDRIPPQAVEIEEALIGAIILESRAIIKVKDIVTPEMMYKEQHKELYSIILNMLHDGKAIDLLTITQELKNLNKLNKIGGASFISKLTSRVGSAAHIKEHAVIIFEKSILRDLINISTTTIERCYEDVDIDELFSSVRTQIEQRLFHILGINSYGISLYEAGNKSLDEYYNRERLVKEGKRTGISSTFQTLDRHTSGWQAGQLNILAARPSIGKTSIALSFLSKAASDGKKIAMYSLETGAVSLTDKLICSIADIELGDYKKGQLSIEDKLKAEQSLDILNNWKVFLNDNLLSNIDQIFASAQAIKSKHGLDLIIIDYLQLLSSNSKKENREREVAENSRKAKMMAMELGCSVILLSQLNRSLESRSDKRPMLSDLRESGAIEQDADIVLLLYRDSYYHSDAVIGQGEIIIAKHREGPTGIIDFYHNTTFTKFSDKPIFNQ